MPISPLLSEPKWKEALKLRTQGEKTKHPKTGVSEALRAYAAVGNQGLSHNAQKETALKAIKTALTKTKNNHKGNTAFLAYISNVEKGIAHEVDRINKEAAALTLQGVLGNPAHLAALEHYCDVVEHDSPPVEFLRLQAGTANATLIATYIRPGAPKELNIYDSERKPWIQAPNNAAAKKLAVDDVFSTLNGSYFPRFKTYLKVAV